MHKPSGLGIYATGNWEDVSESANTCLRRPLDGDLPGRSCSPMRLPDTDMWGVKPFWRKAWSPIGATVLFAEYAQYNDFYGAGKARQHRADQPVTVCDTASGSDAITGSEAERWGLGVVQEINSAAMHVWLRWQHQELDVDIIDFSLATHRGSQSFEDRDLIQAGGIIFF